MHIPVPIFINGNTQEIKSSYSFYRHWINFQIRYYDFYIPLTIVNEHIIGFCDIQS